MKKYIIGLLCLFLAGVCFTACSSGDDDIIKTEDSAEKKANTWIQKTMKDHYLWYDEVPDKDKLNLEEDPEALFYTMLSDQDGVDRNGNHIFFSYIEKKREETKAISEIDPTYGFDYIVYNMVDQNQKPLGFYYARVLYVLPGSPAEEAGLQRDDFIFGVDGKDDNITDYNVLDGGESTVFKMGYIDYTTQKWEDKDDITMPAARVMENNPFLKDSVYQIDGKTIGYLIYNHFSSQAEGKTDKAYDNQMKQIFANFKAKGVNEFVLDLRFNGGGLVSCATLLASLLAPSDALNKTFSKLTYNGKQSNNETVIPFMNTVANDNINLKRLWVLTGQSTASSSEAVINGLKPYIDVRLIGDQTVGKAVGSSPYGDNEDYGWILHPITLRICNAQGDASYSQVGFTPDVEIYEYDYPFIQLYPLGDTREILLSTALDEITGKNSFALRSDQTVALPNAMQAIPVGSSIEKRYRGGLIYQPD